MMYLCIIFIILLIINFTKIRKVIRNTTKTIIGGNKCNYTIYKNDKQFLLINNKNEIIKCFDNEEQYKNYIKFKLKKNDCVYIDLISKYNKDINSTQCLINNQDSNSNNSNNSNNMNSNSNNSNNMNSNSNNSNNMNSNSNNSNNSNNMNSNSNNINIILII